jgi:hypothetical protein
MSARVLAFASVIVAALSVQPASAATVYKSTMPDGSVIFGDQPEPGAKKVESSKPDTSDTGVELLDPGDGKRLREMEEEREEGEEAQDDRRQAEADLRKAEEALANGKEPRPGERIGTAGGASRLTDEYWRRQENLQKDVTEARERLDNL